MKMPNDIYIYRTVAGGMYVTDDSPDLGSDTKYIRADLVIDLIKEVEGRGYSEGGGIAKAMKAIRGDK